MRISMGHLAPLAALTLGVVVGLAAPASAEGTQTGSQSWEACIGTTSTPDERVSACSSVISARSETGRKLAAAYCNRGYGLTEKRELDAALADLDEAIRLDPTLACAYNNRGDARFNKGDVKGAFADFDAAIKVDPKLASAYGNRGYTAA